VQEKHDHDLKKLLAHWTYTRAEWKAFQKWRQMKKGIFHYLLHLIKPASSNRVPEIRISHERVWVNETHEPFHEGERRFRKIDIHDAGAFNIMEISYEKDHIEGAQSGEIRIPIPKGKLREAIAVQEEMELRGGG
jgi:hypothetical protein